MSNMKNLAGDEKVIPVGCAHHCGGACLLKVHVREGVITKIEADDGDEPQLRACLRARAYRQQVYASDRVKYPLKRVGERGEGKFEHISWDEALDTVASEHKRIRDKYGPASILYLRTAGELHMLHSAGLLQRVINLAGGCTTTWGIFSFEGELWAEQATYGCFTEEPPREDLFNSRLIILWGWNPAYTVFRTNTSWYLAKAREKGIKIVSIDPRYSETTAAVAQQWIPIRPSTDAAMLVAMAYVMIKESLHDHKFLAKYTVGFDRFKDYVMGVEDGVAKTPAWAEAITDVPAATIETLAREYATSKPAVLIAGTAPGRTAFGEQYHRLAMTLTAMTGNIGVSGGNFGGAPWSGWSYRYMTRLGEGFTTRTPNPVSEQYPPPNGKNWDELAGYLPLTWDPLVSRNYKPTLDWGQADRIIGGHINLHKVADALLEGKAGGYPADYKLLYIINCNYITQEADSNKTARALKSPEFIVITAQFLTSTAKFADIVLPTCTYMERNDVAMGGGPKPFLLYMNKAIEPLYESRSHLDIARGLADCLGVDFGGDTEEEYLRRFANLKGADIDYGEFKKKGIYKEPITEPYIPHKERIEDPGNNPFPTPSGKIEIYSQQIADLNEPSLPPIPKYIESWEGVNDPLAERYPLQLINSHLFRRIHSQLENLPWLKELGGQWMMINTIDAAARGISNGDNVKVFNERGKVVIRAKVTERIKPGVVDIPEGGWFAPDEHGVDRGGCCNALTRNEPSPCGGFANNCLVQVEKV